MICKSSYSWCAVLVFGITPVFMGVCRGTKWAFVTTWKIIGTKNKIFLENLKSVV